jgi:DNA polymerase-3 subunit epsilon
VNPTEDRDRAIRWARGLLASDNWRILDTETTGISEPEPIQIAILSSTGEVLLDTLVMPTGEISESAEAVHGWTLEKLRAAGAPEFSAVYPRLAELLNDRVVVVYNAQYDSSSLHYTCWLRGAERLRAVWDCAMHRYAEFIGEPRRGRYGQPIQAYRWQKLPGAGHSAVEDCRAVLALIRMMAGARLSTEEENVQGTTELHQ